MADENDQATLDAVKDGGPSSPPPSDADASTSEWDALESASQSERILNQDEIDSLLGFDLSDEDDAGRTGIRAIINSALVSYERLPMLEIVFDRLVRYMTTSLRNFTSTTSRRSVSATI